MVDTRLVLVLSTAMLASCTGPTGSLSPLHPYDYRTGCPAASVSLDSSDMACVVAALDKSEVACYKAADEAARRQCRDEVIGITKKYIDQYWRQFNSNLYGRNGASKTAIETGVTAIGAAGGIATPTTVKSILAAVALSLNSFGVSVEKNLFGDQAVDLLLGQMEADRSIIDQRIAIGLSKPASQYPLAVAMSDLANYSATMSIPHALQSLRQAGGKPAQVVKEEEAAAQARQFRSQ